jgi:nucleotide-binding universal stress UspA family protein
MSVPIVQEKRLYREEMEKELKGIRVPDRKVQVERLLEEGDPAAQILRVAQETNCDLIVMGSHGRTGLDRLLMGSVAEQVVRRASCPVLTVKAPFPLSPSAADSIREKSAKTIKATAGE